MAAPHSGTVLAGQASPRPGGQGEAEASHQPPRWRVVQHVRLQLERRQQPQHIVLLGFGDEAGHVDQALRQHHRADSPSRRGGTGVAGDRTVVVTLKMFTTASYTTHSRARSAPLNRCALDGVHFKHKPLTLTTDDPNDPKTTED
jgi:hypothetical protein